MSQDKVAAFQQKIVDEIYLPAIVHTYNTKAASLGLPGIKTEQDLRNALGMIELIQNTKQAAAANSVNPLNAMAEKAASVVQRVTPTVNTGVVKAAVANTGLASALKSLASE